MDKNILIADDNEAITDILQTYAKKEGFVPIIAHDGEEALQKFRKSPPVIVLLDVMMPKRDGFSVCRELRAESNVPIIMITARGEDADRIMGLDTGADDYVVKPFSPAEVMARIRAILRRIEPASDSMNKEVLQIHELCVNLPEFEVTVAGQPVNLTRKEIELLWLLASNPGRVFSRDNLLNSIWGYDYFGDARTVDTHIKRLRSKMNIQPEFEWDIKTIWGVGYKFEVRNDKNDKK